METDKQKRFNRRWAVMIGIGLALLPIHNMWLTNLVTEDNEVGFFIPAFGYAIWIIAVLFCLFDNWKSLDWGDRKIYIPLLIIAGAIGLSGFSPSFKGDRIAPFLIGMILFSSYLVARKLGKDIFLPLVYGAGVASIGVILFGLFYPGQVNGGFVFITEYSSKSIHTNYDIAAGFILLGAILFLRKYQWAVISLILVAMFFSGSPEAVFLLGILGVIILWRRDWGNKLLIAIIPVTVIAIIWFGLGHGQKLYSYTKNVALNEQLMGDKAEWITRPLVKENKPELSVPEDDELQQKPITTVGYRIEVICHAMSNIKPLGIGYSITEYTLETVHNVPLIIVQQLGWPGVLAGLAWLWVSVWCLIKTKWKYAWILVLSLSVFDHYIWTQLAPWWWAIVGVSMASDVESDRIFKHEAIQ